jgi:U3 small nucleolar ribonucleoprotein protein IMP3
MRRYHIQNRDDYKAYNKVAGMATKLTHLLRQLDASDPARIELTDQLLTKCVMEGGGG